MTTWNLRISADPCLQGGARPEKDQHGKTLSQRLTLKILQHRSENGLLSSPGHRFRPQRLTLKITPAQVKKRASWARLFWGVLVNVPEVFYVYTASTSLPQLALSYQNTMTNDFLMHSDATFDTGGGWNVVRKSRPGHAVSLFWRVLFQQLPQACHNQQYRTTTLWFSTGFRRDVRHGRGMKCGSKMLLVGRPGHAVSALLAVCLGVGLRAKSYKIVEKLVWSDQKQ